MKTNQERTITFDFSKFGYKCIVTPLFFTTFQEMIGLDIKPLFVQWFRSKIEHLQKAQELGALTEQGQLDLENCRTAEQILTSC